MSEPKEGQKLFVDFNKRVFSKNPPIIAVPQLRSDLSGFSTVDELIGRLTRDHRPIFPYEKELVLYLLLIASLWPNDYERLLTAARLFSGALNFHFSRAPKDMYRRARLLRRKLSRKKINFFNKHFFVRIGGPPSLLFCPSVERFHRDVWERIAELTIILDFTEYIFKSSILSKKICSASFAYHAIANNIFSRKGGYGVAEGPKRKSKRGNTTAVTTAESVRAKCKHAPETTILSFIMTRWYPFHFFDPANPNFFLVSFRHNESGRWLKVAISMIRDRLLLNMSALNTSITRWALVNSPMLDKPAHLYTLSAEELERAFKIYEGANKRPLSREEQDAARQKRAHPPALAQSPPARTPLRPAQHRRAAVTTGRAG
jgi:hypothetical protein